MIATIPVGTGPEAVAVDPAAGTVYVANTDSGTVSVIDAATSTVTATIRVGTEPYGVAADPAAGTVYVTNYGSNTVSVIDVATGAVTATLPVGSGPYGVAVDPSAGTAGTVYVTKISDNTVSVIDAATSTVTATLPVGSSPDAVAVDPATHAAYVTNQGDNTVSVISAQAAQAISFTSTPPASPVVGGTYLVSATGGGSGNPVTFTVDASSTSVCSISGAVVTFNAACRCVIDANQAGDAGYQAAPQVQQTVTVGAAAAVLSWAVPAAVTYGAALGGAQLDATASVPGTFSYSPPAGTVLHAGTQTLTATFTPADPVDYTGGTVSTQIMVSPAPLTAQVDGSQTYGGSPAFTVSGYSGLVNGDTAAVVTGSLAGCATSLGAGAAPGTYPGTISGCSGLSSPDYAISYADAGVTVGPAALTVTASSGPMTYGGTPPVITASYTGFVHGDSAASLTTAPACSTTATPASPPGTYPSSCSGAVDPDYAISYAGGTVTVGQAAQAITFTSTPPASPVVGGTYSVSAAGGGSGNPVAVTIDASSASVCSISGPVVTFNAAGSCVVDANQAGNADYHAAPQAQQTVTVSRAAAALSWSAPAAVTYGVALGGAQLDAAASVPGSFSYSPPAGTVLHAGTQMLSATFTPADPADYIGGTVTTKITVDPAPLTVTASSGAMTYGGPPPAITASYAGFVHGDGAASLTAGPACSTTATSASPAGSYPSSCSGAVDPDYAISYAGGTVTVSPAWHHPGLRGPGVGLRRDWPGAGRDPVEPGRRLPGRPAGHLRPGRQPEDGGRRDLPAGVGDHQFRRRGDRGLDQHLGLAGRRLHRHRQLRRNRQLRTLHRDRAAGGHHPRPGRGRRRQLHRRRRRRELRLHRRPDPAHQPLPRRHQPGRRGRLAAGGHPQRLRHDLRHPGHPDRDRQPVLVGQDPQPRPRRLAAGQDRGRLRRRLHRHRQDLTRLVRDPDQLHPGVPAAGHPAELQPRHPQIREDRDGNLTGRPFLPHQGSRVLAVGPQSRVETIIVCTLGRYTT